ncbi:hypothetical protein Sru01_61620 [Sphaerisporangium rufum]|uniref:Uncharacterized protein n=1 Tax=Sphaerisporangium rufum TaxID=1381558 RepID=A0A919V8A9_9ACTN|nr:DUF6703 family protein [Sphaerisporangium rufum]GII81180.1 hypothetical protein Sru01_61620 [Sphaerisporangium rufum]
MADKHDPTRRPPAAPPSGRDRAVPPHPLARRPAARRGPRPLPPGEHFMTPGATGLRRAVERRSAAPLVFLYRLPRWLIPVVLVALLLVGFAVADWRGGIAVLPVLGFVLWLAYMSWPSLGTFARFLRVALVTFLVLFAAARFGVF